MSEPVRISPIVEADVAAIALLDGPTHPREEDLRAELALPWSRIWVAREEGDGVVAFTVFWHVSDEVHLLNLATRPDRRRRGFARAILSEVVEYARKNQARKVLLEVRRSNLAAIELYRSLGFGEGGTRAGYYQDGEDALEMALALTPDTVPDPENDAAKPPSREES